MVFLILTKVGMARALEAAQATNVSVWMNADLLGQEEAVRLRASGLDLATFTRRIDPFDREDVEGAVVTIREHHPEQMLFVEWPDRTG